MKSYLFLAAAILCEIIATTFLKYSNGYTKWLPAALSLLFYLGCHIFFSKAVTQIHLGIGYAIWCGVGIVATTLISFLVFREKISASGLLGIFCILAGCVILNLGGN